MDPFISEIRLFSWGFVPQGWLACNGALLPIDKDNQYVALYSLIGATFGGDGKTNFALPDLRGRAVVCADQGGDSFLTPVQYPRGTAAGSETVALVPAEIPQHSHSVAASNAVAADKALIAGNLPGLVTGIGSNTAQNIYTWPESIVALGSGTVSTHGGGLPHENMQPFLVLNFCIAYQGWYPPRQ